MNIWIKVIIFGMSAIILLIFILLIIRYSGEREVDDVTPVIECEDWIIRESGVLWVIPIYENQSIAENKTWCGWIRGLNKTLGMHGVHHTYREFEEKRDEEYIKKGIEAFEGCFGFKPLIFKAPQMVLSGENEWLLESMGMRVEGGINQILSRVYHCSDTGKFSNGFIDWF